MYYLRVDVSSECHLQNRELFTQNHEIKGNTVH
jgi:hypothetical protein